MKHTQQDKLGFIIQNLKPNSKNLIGPLKSRRWIIINNIILKTKATHQSQ